jgi:hypothetical protein
MVGTGGGSSGPGVVGQGVGSGIGVVGNGGPANGPGVVGNGGSTDGSGVQGYGVGTGAGVIGVTEASVGVGVLAENAGGGNALQVEGPAIFSRSGLATVPAGVKKITVTGVSLTSASLILAVAQQAMGRSFVTSAVPDVPGSQFTINVGFAPKLDMSVAWFVVN